jgi:hypothetical protein
MLKTLPITRMKFHKVNFLLFQAGGGGGVRGHRQQTTEKGDCRPQSNF